MARSLKMTARVTKPTGALAIMALFLVAVSVVCWFLIQQIEQVFRANVYLNGLIVLVFLVGVGYTFWLVLRLRACVEWIEAFNEDRPGLEAIAPPRLFASTAALLRQKDSRRSLTATTVRSILDSIASRLAESREIARYILALLIFLGLLGTFWGLSNTVPAVVDTIKSIAPVDGSPFDINKLMQGLEAQLGGMGTAFASSLLGLAGSLIVGFLDLIAGHAQNRFYGELEESLSHVTSIARNEEGGVGSEVIAELLERNSATMGELIEAMIATDGERRAATQQLEMSARALDAVVNRLHSDETALMRLSESQDGLRVALEHAVERNRGVLGGMDEATRQHIRSMDAQILRLAEEIASGRQDAVADLRAELKMLARSFAAIADRSAATDRR